MRKRLSYINPWQVGKVVGALGGLYSFFGWMFILVTVGIGMITGNNHGLSMGLDPIAMLLVMPLIGFVYGLLGAAVYNLIAKWTGGIEFTVSEVVPAEVPPWPQALPHYPFAPKKTS